MAVFLMAGALSGAAAGAQEPKLSLAPTEACLAAAADEAGREACVGKAADACMETPDGLTTVGMGMCLRGEGEFWDTRLNAAYGALLTLEEAAAAELKALGSAAPSPAEALRAMQRAWVPFRDAACAWEASQWGGGTGAGPASADCWMRQTARQALALEAELAERESR